MNTNRKTINETDLKQMIKESIEEVLSGFNPNWMWEDPNSQARQFGDVWLFKTYELLDEMGISCNPHKLRELLKPIVLEILVMDKEMKK